MSAPTVTEPSLHDTLTGQKLPRWAPWLVAAVALVAAIGLTAVGPILGLAWYVLWGLLFLVGQTLWSFLVEGRRHSIDRLATTLVYTTFGVALLPLAAVLFQVVRQGIEVMRLEFFTDTMRNVSPRREGGGIAHALVGTLEQVGIATLIAVPIGILVAIYLVEYGRRSRLALLVSFFVDVMTGVPSIIAGLFIYTFWILTLGFERSGFAASLALVILMIPVIVRTTEEMLRIVPNDLREASYALGVPKWKTIVRIVVPTALGGIITGVMLAVARVAGETAPLLLTTFLSQSMNWNPFQGPQASLPLFVWDNISSGTAPSVARAWGGALVLILLVMLFYVAAKIVAARFAPKAR